jgi:hypothetical protein
MDIVSDWLTLRRIVLLAGALHFCQFPAAFMVPNTLNWKEELKRLSPLNRRIFLVISLAIMWVGLGLGGVVIIGADEIVSGRPLGVALCFFLGVFWGYRAAVQIFLYSKIWIGGTLGWVTHHGLSGLLVFMSGLYFLIGILGLMKGS